VNDRSAELASPWVGVCKMDPTTDLCRGCRRTLDEIAGWTDFSAVEKLTVLMQLSGRKPRSEENAYSRRIGIESAEYRGSSFIHQSVFKNSMSAQRSSLGTIH